MQFEVGSILEGTVTGITKFGAFVELPGGKTGMVHISEIAPTYVNEIKDFVQEQQVVKVKVLSIGEDGKVSLSIKRAMDPQQHNRPQQKSSFHRAPRTPRAPAPPVTGPGNFEWTPRRSENASFEDMMLKYKQSSEEKMSDIKKNVDSKRGSSMRRGGKS